MSFEITPMRNRVLPIALGAAVAVVSLGAIAIPAANAQPMVVVVLPVTTTITAAVGLFPLLQPPWLAPACCSMASPTWSRPISRLCINSPFHQQPVYTQPTAVMAPAGW